MCREYCAAVNVMFAPATAMSTLPSTAPHGEFPPSLPMIPLFALAGYFLAEGGAPRRLVRVFNALFGGLRGGAAIVSVLACAFFTSFSGASGVTIIALGGMLMPLLVAAGYSQRAALGLLTGAGSLGGLLPPGLPLVLYAIVAKVSIEDMFLAGLSARPAAGGLSRCGACALRLRAARAPH
jgi:TRAP-type C4-dicarboxylate transport system permease large subunit